MTEYISHREGELEKFLSMKEKFVELLTKYSDGVDIGLDDADESESISRLLQIVFYIGICNYRHYYPTISDIQSMIDFTGIEFEHLMHLLQKWSIINHLPDVDNSKIKRAVITEAFWSEFDQFIFDFIDMREKTPVNYLVTY